MNVITIDPTLHRETLGFAHYIFLELVPSINYVIFPIVQTLSSHDLR